VVVPELRTCRVSFQDAAGIAHSVEVTAQSLFEAAALAIKAFRAADWMESGPGAGAVLANLGLAAGGEAPDPATKGHGVVGGKCQNAEGASEQAAANLRELLENR
jgi:hypothetical protein